MDRVLGEEEPGAEARDDRELAPGEGLRVAVVGRPNVGKSTLINRLLGEERVIACDMPGTTRDSLFIPFQHGDRNYTLIDTAGIRRRARISDTLEKFSVIKALQSIAEAQAVILVVDAQDGISDQDTSLAAHILDSGRALVVAVNKWDGLKSTERTQVKDALQLRLGFLDFASWHYISALHGSGVGLLLDTSFKPTPMRSGVCPPRKSMACWAWPWRNTSRLWYGAAQIASCAMPTRAAANSPSSSSTATRPRNYRKATSAI